MNQEQKAGRIYEQGYRPYEGAYQGRAHILRHMVTWDMRRAVGVKKRWPYKILIFILIAAATVPAIAVLGVTVLIRRTQDFRLPIELLPFGQLYEMINTVILILSALIASDLLTNDRRYRVLPLYLSRPIRRYDYVIGKAIAIFAVLGLVTLVPPLVLYIGNMFFAPSPWAYLTSHLDDLSNLLIAGVALMAFYGFLAMAISSLTISRNYAAGGFIGLIAISETVSNAVFELTDNEFTLLGALGEIPIGVNNSLFGLEGPLAGGYYALTLVFVIIVSLAIVYWRYAKEEG